MPKLVIEGQTRTSQTLLDHGITDMLVHRTAEGTMLYTTSGPNGGLSAFAIGPDGGLTLIDYAHFHASFSDSVLDSLTLMHTADGPRLVVAGDADGSLTAYALGADGMIDAPSSINGLVGGEVVFDLEQWGSDILFLAGAGDGAIHGYSIDTPTLLSRQFTVADTASTYGASVFALEILSMGGADYLLGASVAEQGVTAYRIEQSGLVATGNLGIAEGIGLMTPTAMATAQIGGRHFVLLGSAPGDGIGQSGAITVMELHLDGSLMPTDHVIDTLHTRFGMIQALDVVTANGFSYVIAAGGDDGVTVFVLLPNGRLQMIDVMADTYDIGLENVTAVATFHDGTDLHMFLSSETSAGLTEISLDTSRNGVVTVARNDGGQTLGTAGEDILIGGTGDDVVAGALGDDILEDGAGSDTLSGGEGHDIFILRGDGARDMIRDFEPGRDRIDLSDWPFFYDAAGLEVVSTAEGAIVTWRGETLVIQTLHGTSLTQVDVHAAILSGPDRSPVSFDALQPPVGNQTLTGGAGGDLLIGDAGNDLILGGGGDDTLRGGAGDDTLNGGDLDQLSDSDGADRFEGGEGTDWVSYRGSFGSLRVDLQFPQVNTFAAGGDTYSDIENVWGSQGPDNIRGTMNEDNHLLGDRNVDYLYGRSGDDTLDGGIGDDVMFGGPGADLLTGGQNRDRAQYSESATALVLDLQFPHLNTGEAAGDIHVSIEDLAGSEFADTIAGDPGPNRLFGRNGADRLFGRDGDDYLNGGAHSDWLDGGAGDDTLRGGTHADTFIFNGGRDVIEDFSFAQADRIGIDSALIPAVSGLDGADVVATYGSVINGRVMLDFGVQGSTTILSLATLDTLDAEIFVY